MMKFYDKLPDMECLSGDTLGTFKVAPRSGDFSGCRMQVIIVRYDSPEFSVICKECTSDSGGFSVQLTSEDTAKLREGMHFIHFRLVDSQGLSYRKLAGRIYVHDTAKGAELT